MTITLNAFQQQRRDTAANWTSQNPTLKAAEIGYETDTGYIKVGDGSTAWTSLAYIHGTKVSAYPLATVDIANDAITGDKLANDITIANNLTVTNNLTVNGTTTTIDTTTLVVEDKNIELGVVTTPTDVTADGGGITLKGATDKTINWVDSTDAWTFSEHVNIASGKEYRIAGTKVLDATSLGSAVVSSSLTSVGTLTSGTWSASTIAVDKGGTGQTSYTNGQLLIGNTTGNTLSKATLTAGSNITITNGAGSIEIAGTAGTVTSVDVSGGTGLTATGGPVTSSGTISVSLDDTAVTAGSYTAADITVDAQGRITAAASGTIGTSEIADDSVTADKLADTSVTAGSYTTADITVDAQGRITAASSGSAGAGDKISEGNTEAEVVDTGSDGHFKVTTEGTERVRVGPAGQIGLAGANYGTDGQCLTSTGTTTAPEWRTPPLSFRNKIINGDMCIDQRNDGAALTVNSTSKHFAVDRFYAENSSNGVFTLQQSSEAPAGFKNSIVATVTTASGALSGTHYAAINSQIEGQDIYDLDLGTSDAKYFTLSFWVRSSVTGTYGGSFRNNNDSRNYPFSYSISSANTWEKKYVTVAGDTSGTWLTDNDVGLKVWFSLATGSTYSGTAGAWTSTLHIAPTGATNLLATNSATWYLTGVQLEVGQEGTPFEQRSYGDQLARCQRYFQYITYFSGSSSYQVNSAHYHFGQHSAVAMRIQPTASTPSGSGTVALTSSGADGYRYPFVYPSSNATTSAFYSAACNAEL